MVEVKAQAFKTIVKEVVMKECVMHQGTLLLLSHYAESTQHK
jgi:hypothetical protein